MVTKYYKPLLSTNIGNVYYPDGLPDVTDDSIPMVSLYNGVNGEDFSIVYTHKQIIENVKRNGGWFCPYIPLGVYG